MEAYHAFFEGFNHLFLNIGRAIPGFAEFIHDRIQAADHLWAQGPYIKVFAKQPFEGLSRQVLEVVQAFLNRCQIVSLIANCFDIALKATQHLGDFFFVTQATFDQQFAQAGRGLFEFGTLPCHLGQGLRRGDFERIDLD